MTAPAVAHVLWEDGIGGIQRLVHQLARRQSEAGMPVAVIFCRRGGLFAEALTRDGVQIFDLAMKSGFDLRPRLVLRSTARLRSFDVLHAHGFNIPLGAAEILARRPIVFTEHGSYGVGRRFGTSKRHVQRLFLRRRSVTIAANSRFTAEQLGAHYGFGVDDVQVVPNGVEFGPPREQAASVRDAELTVGFVGRWAEVKRLDRALRALAIARRQADVRLVLVGGGPCEDKLRALAAELGLTASVEFLGPRLDLEEILDRIDVVVQPGIESFGLSIIEGCGHGALPVVFADGGGAVEVLPPDGIVVDDVDQLGQVLADLPSSPGIGPEGRARRAAWARETYDIDRTVAGYRLLYDRALRGR